MALDPGVGVAFDIRGLVLALAHQKVLGVDVGHRQPHDFKQLGRGRIFFGPGLVGHDLLLVHDKAVVLAVGQLGVDLLAGQ